MRPLIVFSESKAMQESFIHKFNFILWSQGKLCLWKSAQCTKGFFIKTPEYSYNARLITCKYRM